MDKEIRIMNLKNRISLLTNRSESTNAAIIAKLKRKLRQLQK